MDDRTAVAHSYEQLVAIQNVWRNFAQRFHVIENVDKAQLVDMTGATAHLGTKNSFEVLGTILGKPPVLEFRKFGKLMQRFNKSLHMAHRVAMLPESTSAKHHDICVFSGAAMAYGWIGTDHRSTSRMREEVQLQDVGVSWTFPVWYSWAKKHHDWCFLRAWAKCFVATNSHPCKAQPRASCIRSYHSRQSVAATCSPGFGFSGMGGAK